MRKRPIKLQIWINEIESNKLNEIAKKSGNTISDVIRKLILGVRLKEKPSYEFYDDMRELSKIGVNVNQLARKANTINAINKAEYQQQADDWKKFKNKIITKYLEDEI